MKQVPDYRVEREKWEKQTEQTNDFLDKLTEKIYERNLLNANEIEVNKAYLKQASARQGLKINAPDEYDVIIPLIIKGLDIQTACVKDTDGKVISGFERQRVMNKDDLNSTHPRMSNAKVFTTTKDGTVFLNSKNFYQKIWMPEVDKALADIQKEMPDLKFQRREHPPSVNIQVTYPDGRVVNFDIVPGNYTGTEQIQIPSEVTGKQDTLVEFPSFALPKYDNKNNPRLNSEDRELIFRSCTSSYERYMADLCRSSPERQYIMAANCIIKNAIKTLQEEQNPLGNLINSYHLKTIAYHIIMDKTILSKMEITGVKDALGLHLTYIRKYVSERYLPDFFLGNKNLAKIFPGSKILENHRQLNLFWKANPRLLLAAINGLKRLLEILEGCFTCPNGLS